MWVENDGKRVKEGVIDRGWDIVFVVVKRHITRLAVGEADSRDSPGAGA